MPEKHSTDELLLVTMAGRSSPRRPGRAGLARLVALFIGIAVALLLGRAEPARAAGLESFMPDGIGISVSLPLGDFAGERPSMNVFAVVDDHDRSPAGISLPGQRMAFLDIASVGSMAGVASWPADRIAPRRRSASSTAAATRKPHARAVTASSSRVSVPDERKSAAAGPSLRVQAAGVRQAARRATAVYRQLRQHYVAGLQRPATSVAREHARLVEAYRIALKWRRYAGIE